MSASAPSGQRASSSTKESTGENAKSWRRVTNFGQIICTLPYQLPAQVSLLPNTIRRNQLTRVAQPAHCFVAQVCRADITRTCCMSLIDQTEIQRSVLAETAIALSKIVLDFTSCAPWSLTACVGDNKC